MEVRQAKNARNDFFWADGPVFRQTFYTTAMAYDRRERGPFPLVNVYHCRNCVFVQALVPGVERKDIGIRLEDGELILEGNIPRADGRYFHKERYSGPFCRRIQLGTPVQNEAEIRLENGILQILFNRG